MKYLIIILSFLYINVYCQVIPDSIQKEIIKLSSNISKSEYLYTIASKEAGKNVNQSNIYAKQAIIYLGKINSSTKAKIAAKIYRTIALNYYYNGNNDSSLIACQKALVLSKKLKDDKEIADSYLSMQTAYREMGRYDKAIEVCSQALKHYDIIKDIKGKAKSTLNIGILYDDQLQPEKAIKYLSSACNLFKEIKDTAQIANAITRLANVYKETSSQDTAKTMYLEALKLFESINHKRGIAVIYNNLAGLNNIISSSEALKYYEIALKARMELGDKVSVCMIYNNIGAEYMNEKKYEKAIEALQKGLLIGEEIDTKQNLLNIYHALAGCYHKLNKNKEAYSYIYKYSSLKDSLFNKESLEKIEEIQTKYETEKKEQEIIMLNNTNSIKELEIKKNKAEISKQNQQKLIIVFVLIFVIIIGVIIYKNYLKTKKAKEIISYQKKEIEHQRNEVIEKQKEIVDSINYAKKIQYALLSNEDFFKNNLEDHFILFKPKDIVSGDFYWSTKINDDIYIAVCDSTGHGVPGAFMSLLNIGYLSEAINEKQITEPNEILNYVRTRLKESISKDGQKDGFDGILIKINKKEKHITYAAAYNAPILVADGVINELPKDKMPVGSGEKNESFKQHIIPIKNDEWLYLYTDGYADQFGGPKGKKLKYKPLNELLLSISSKSSHIQKEILDTTFENWKGQLEQIDDVCIVGIRV